MSIQIFACDHRKNIKWNLPYTRFGGLESECAIKCENKIFDKKVNPDETPKLFWLWNNIDEFGVDVIGYCQYRRFFSKLQASTPILNINSNQFNVQMALTPLEQYNVIVNTNTDGILHYPINVIHKSISPFKYIWEQIYILENENMLDVKYLKLAFDLLLKHTPQDLKPYMEQAFEKSENYLCNIFTVKTHIFKLFGKIAFNAVYELLNIIPEKNQKIHHPYWLAYLFERYTSCFYHTLILSGKYKFVNSLLLTIDANKHIKWTKTQK